MSVSIYRAIQLISKNSFTFTNRSEIIPIEESLGRVNYKTLYASLALPPFDNSAMDGYAISSQNDSYEIVDKALAGNSSTASLKDHESIKVATGAKLPQNTQSVIPQEDVTIVKNKIIPKKEIKTSSNIRYKGEDIDIGEVIINSKEQITSATIALLASQGITHIEVFQKPRIAIFASGSELKLHYENLEDSQIYNSNTPYLFSRCIELGCSVTFLGSVKDDLKSIRNLISNTIDRYDLIITSGGVSVGEADFTKEAFNSFGFETIFEKVAIKPGKPTTFGKINNSFILNLPGNPLALSLNFEIFGKFLINKLKNLKTPYHSYIETKISKKFIKNKKVDTVIPGFFDGNFFHVAKKFSPGMVNVLNHCNGFIIISKDKECIKENEIVKFLPIEWGFYTQKFKEFIT